MLFSIRFHCNQQIQKEFKMKNNFFAKTMLSFALLFQAGKSFGLEEPIINENKISGTVHVEVFQCRNDIVGMPALPFYLGNVQLDLSELDSSKMSITRTHTFKDQSKLNLTIRLINGSAKNPEAKLLIITNYEYRKATKVMNRNGREINIYDTFSEPREINKREVIPVNSLLNTSTNSCHDDADVGNIELATIVEK